MKISRTILTLFVLHLACRQVLSGKLKDGHDKEGKTEEEQADYDKEVLFGGEEDAARIHEMSEEEQQEKLREFIVTKMDANSDG